MGGIMWTFGDDMASGEFSGPATFVRDDEATKRVPIQIVEGLAKEDDSANGRGWIAQDDPPVSLQLPNGTLLRHQNGTLKAHHGSDALYRLDASWFRCWEMVKSGTCSFQSSNYPSDHICMNRQVELCKTRHLHKPDQTLLAFILERVPPEES